MSFFQKILHAGEGKRLKAVQAIVPEVNALEPEIERLSDEQLLARTAEFKRQVDRARSGARDPEHEQELVADAARRPAPRGVRDRPRGRQARARPAPLRRAGHGRRRAAPRLGRRDEDRRGQDARRDAAVVPERARRPRRAPRHGQRLPRPAATRSGWASCTASSASRSARSSPTTRRPTQKRAQYDCDITYGTNNEFGFDYLRDNMVVEHRRPGAARRPQPSWSPHFFAIVDEVDSILIDEARTPLIISGRADRRGRALLPVRPHRARACSATATTRSTRRSAPSSRPRRASRASRRRSASRTSTSTSTRTTCTSSSRRCAPRSCSSATSTTSCSDGEVKIVDEFTGRILEGRRWSEGLHQAVEAKEGVQDQGGEPDARDGHAAELLPHVRQALGHDRHRVDRGRRVRAHLRPPGRVDPDQPADGPRRQRRLHLQDRGREVRRRGRRHRRAARERASRCSSARSRSRSRRSCRACSRSRASRTRC